MSALLDQLNPVRKRELAAKIVTRWPDGMDEVCTEYECTMFELEHMLKGAGYDKCESCEEWFEVDDLDENNLCQEECAVFDENREVPT